jgi:spermidine synthase
MARRIERSTDPIRAFGALEIALGLISVATLFLLLPANRLYGAGIGGAKYFAAAFAAAALVLPPTLLLGAIFPCATRAYAAGRPDTGAAVGRAYAINTVGGILGSLAAGFALIPLLGTTRAIVLLAAVNVAGGGILLWYSPGLRRRAVPIFAASAAALALAAAPLLATDLFYRVVRDRVHARYPRLLDIRWHREDTTATVTVFSTLPGSGREKKHLWVNGQGMTSLVTVTKLMAHLPIVLGPDPPPGGRRRVLVICFGMGTTVRSAARWPDTDVEAVELVPAVIEAFPRYHRDARAVLAAPNVRVRVGDGRNWLLLSERKYEVITVDPAPPIYSAGTVNLYSREFMQLAKDALTEDGVAQFWVSSVVTPDEFRMLIATFRSVFPEGTVWSGNKIPGYFLIGARNGPLRIDPESFRRRWAQPAVRADLAEWDDLFVAPEAAMELYVAGGERMAALAGGAPLITDNHPWVEFPLFRYLGHGKKRYPKKRLLADREPIPLVHVTQ